MKKALLLFSFFFCTFLKVEAQAPDANLGIIPAPESINATTGYFLLIPDAGITIEYGNSSDRKIAQMFHDFLKQHYSLDLPVTNKAKKTDMKIIRFSSNNYNGGDKESYKLTITPSEIKVSGKDAGLFYGLQTLMQLFSFKEGPPISIPCAEIIDAPRYKYRGMMLDVCLHFYPVSFIKELLDLMAEYKLNTFHWHLTEDQGWRIEIKKYPLLTSVGGFRNGTIIGRYPGTGNDSLHYGGFYTQQEVKDIVKYAQDRYIIIIPEIEMPGHSSAAIAAYPQLSCFPDESTKIKSTTPWAGSRNGKQVQQTWGVFEDVYCPSDYTFKFLENVLTEVLALFPSHYIHIGGDECPKDSWKKSAFCQQLMKEKGLKNEDELQSYFIRRIEEFLNSKGREIIGWDEILEGGLAPNAVVQSWRGIKGGIETARQGHDVVMSPRESVYFDYLQGKEIQEPLGIGGFTPLKNVYDYNPTPAELTTQQQKHIIGVEACLWTEYMPTNAKVEYMFMPRMLALSEIAWSPLDRKDYVNFSSKRVPKHLAKLDSTKILYRVPEVIGIEDTVLYGGNFSFTLIPSVSGANIFYTIDGYTPDATTYLYKPPLAIVIPKGEKRILQIVVITPSGKRSKVTRTLLDNASSPGSPR